MTKDQILEVLKIYESDIRTPAKRSPDDVTPVNMPEVLGHLSWICKQVPRHMENKDDEKIQRLLGFIQGAMWTLGIRTIDQIQPDVK